MNYGLLTKSVISILLIIQLTSCGTSKAVKDLIGTNAPTLRFYSLEDGSPVTLYSYPNTDKLILFWNTKCGPSKKALARLDNLAQKIELRDKSSFYCG